jgi:hypothetical protein
VDGARLFTGVPYQALTSYRPLVAGPHRVQTRSGARPALAPAPLDVTLGPGSYHTLVVGGRFARAAQLLLADGLATPPPGRALLRVLNLALGLPPVDCDVANAPVVFEGLAFAHVAGYQPVEAGGLGLICRASGTGRTLFATGRVDLRAGDVESLVAVGGLGRPLELVRLADAAPRAA